MADRPEVVEAVLSTVEQIPAGSVMTYGDVGEYIGLCGPRTVARVLSTQGGGVPWWRVVRADGTSAEPVRERQLARLRAEGVRIQGERIPLASVRWAPVSR